MFDSKLNFSSHITAMIRKAKQRLFLIKKSFTSGENDALVLALKTYIIPLLEHCSSFGPLALLLISYVLNQCKGPLLKLYLLVATCRTMRDCVLLVCAHSSVEDYLRI